MEGSIPFGSTNFDVKVISMLIQRYNLHKSCGRGAIGLDALDLGSRTVNVVGVRIPSSVQLPDTNDNIMLIILE